MKIFPDFQTAINAATLSIRDLSVPFRPTKWQGFDVSAKPEAEMRELLDFDFKVAMPTTELAYYRSQVLPNLPWADDHFEERVSGWFNPGKTWRSWPWALKADSSRIFDVGGEEKGFSHTYGTRYWGRYDRKGVDRVEMHGHLFRYGDLDDVVSLLAGEPDTRQAYLPVWFPEDTGAVHGNRVPCTLGYFWILRGGYLHVHYPIRSCDFYRHFRDDIYLTVRLTLWLLDRLREAAEAEQASKVWLDAKPGFFSMWIGSFHLFINDYRKLFPK